MAKITPDEALGLLGNASSSLLKDLGENTVPLLQEYLKELRGLRMAIHTEIRDILQSVGTLRELVKTSVEIEPFVESMMKLEKILTPEFIERARKLMGQ
jgi:hypothetical protein